MLTRFIAATVVRPVTTTMVTVAVLLFGLVAATRLPVDLLPDLSYPTITVRTEIPDAAPAEVEELVTRPVEERVGAVPGVIAVESVSREGESEVVLDFAWGTSIDNAMADVREKLDRVVLPTLAERPIVLRYDPSQEPIMRLALGTSAEVGTLAQVDLAVLRQAADRMVKRELEKLPGVAAVELHGGEEDEIVVELDPARLTALGLAAQDVVTALDRGNVNRPGGALTERDSRYLIRTLHEARTPEELGAIIVRSSNGAELRVRDVARVRRTSVEREELSLVNGREAVELAVFREGDANLVAVSHTVLAQIDDLPLLDGHEVVVLSNRADFIESAIAEVRDNTLVGGGLAVLVLLFFLRDLRSTLVIAIAIPISVLATFIPLGALGVSLNVMSLGGLALGVGMLVDNSIVVLESIARVGEQSTTRSRSQTAVLGAAEVAPSVVASTLTTVAVFLPMAFVEGVAGQLVRDLSYTVSFSLVSSLVVSLSLVPVLLALGEPAPADHDETAPRSRLVMLLTFPIAVAIRGGGTGVATGGRWASTVSRPLTRAYDALETRYPAVVRFALRHRAAVLLTALAICVTSVMLAADRGRTLIPEIDQGEFFVQVSLPRGASLERTTEVMQALGRAVADDPDVQTHYTRIGSVTVAGSATGGTAGSHLGQINVRLAATITDRTTRAEQLFERIAAANIEPDAVLQMGYPALLSFAPPLQLLMFSEDLSAATAHAEALLPDLRRIPGLVDIIPDDLEGRPEVSIRFDRERLSRIGLTVDDAALAVQRAIQGEVATTVYASDQQLAVRVQLPRADRQSVEDVSRVQIGVVEGITVPLRAVADVQSSIGPAEIRRIDGRRGVRIQARPSTVDLAGAAAAVQTVLDVHATPNVETEIAGQVAEMESSLRSLALTAAMSLFLVYVVMASSFESLLHPFLILFTVPLAVAGTALACWLANLPISAMVGIGVVVLGGIVVNNAIVLINAVNDRRGMGATVGEALVAAGQVRVRPILMTTLTTILGLVPMAIGLGDGAALRQPLAVAIIGGLGLSTLLTLVVIPCAYSLLPGRNREAWRQRAGELGER